MTRVGGMPGSHWRAHARKVIDRVIAESRALGLDAANTLKAIDLAYPFGQRAHWPYKMWLLERRRARSILAGGGEARAWRCPACGAAPDKACRDIATDAALPEHHEARRQLARPKEPPAGPLFGD